MSSSAASAVRPPNRNARPLTGSIASSAPARAAGASPTGLESRHRFVVGDQPQIGEIGAVDRLPTDDESRRVESRPRVQVAARRELGLDPTPCVAVEDPQVVQRGEAGGLACVQGQGSLVRPPAAMKASLNWPPPVCGRHVRPGLGHEVVGARVREAGSLLGEAVAHPQPSVRAEGDARPVARGRHRAAGGQLPPGIGRRVICPEVAEEGRWSTLAGEDHDADSLDPGCFVAESWRGRAGRAEFAPGPILEIEGPGVGEHGGPAAATEQVGDPGRARHRPGVVLPWARPRDVETLPCQGRRLGGGDGRRGWL